MKVCKTGGTLFLAAFLIFTLFVDINFGAQNETGPGSSFGDVGGNFTIKVKPQRLFKKFTSSSEILIPERSVRKAALYEAPVITSDDLIKAFSSQNTPKWYYVSEAYKDSSILMDVGDVDYLNPQHWELPNVQLKESERIKGIPLSQVPYKEYFPNATHCKKFTYPNGNYYEIYGISDSMVVISGVVDSVSNEPYFDLLDFLITPLPLDIDTDFIVNTIIYYPDNSSTEFVEYIFLQGFGTLTTPWGDFEVLKIFNDYLHIEYDSTGTMVDQKKYRFFKFISKEGHLLTLSLKDGEPLNGVTEIENLEFLKIDMNTTDVTEDKQTLPKQYVLQQNYPNPFNPETIIEYRLGSMEYVNLKVYDALGREVAVLVNEYQNPGNYRVFFDSRNSTNNRQLTSGIYFYTLSAGNYSETKKMVLLR